MSDLMAGLLSGLNAASQRFEASARRTVADRNADLPAELVTQKIAAVEFEANLEVMAAASRTMKRTLDILA